MFGKTWSSSGRQSSKSADAPDPSVNAEERTGIKMLTNHVKQILISFFFSLGSRPANQTTPAPNGPKATVNASEQSGTQTAGSSSNRRKKLLERYESSLKGDKANGRASRLPMCMSLHFLPEEFAPHWLCSPIRILDGVCLLCTAEASAHAVQAALLLVLPLPPKASFDPLVAALYLAFVVGKILCTGHQWLLCSSVLYHCRTSAQQAAANAASTSSNSTQSTPCISSEGVVLFPLQSTAQRLQRRGALWSLGLMVQVCFVIPSIGLRKLSMFTGSVSLLSIFAHFYGFIEV